MIGSGFGEVLTGPNGGLPIFLPSGLQARCFREVTEGGYIHAVIKANESETYGGKKHGQR